MQPSIEAVDGNSCLSYVAGTSPSRSRLLAMRRGRHAAGAPSVLAMRGVVGLKKAGHLRPVALHAEVTP